MNDRSKLDLIKKRYSGSLWDLQYQVCEIPTNITAVEYEHSYIMNVYGVCYINEYNEGNINDIMKECEYDLFFQILHELETYFNRVLYLKIFLKPIIISNC